MLVMKFGGSSVENADAIRQVLSVVKNRATENERVAVVVSALRYVTDALQDCAHKAEIGDDSYKKTLYELEERHLTTAKDLIKVKDQGSVAAGLKVKFNELENVLHGIYLIRELSARTKDFVLSFGERLSAFLIAAAFNSGGVPAQYLDARKIIITDEKFGSASILKEETYKNIQDHFSKVTELQVVTGFVSGSKKGRTTTLGRGGSDYTASILGAALKANRIEIFTDVSGVLSADPRKVKSAHPIPILTYEEAMELSHFGAKVIYPPTMQPAMDAGVPIVVKNTFAPEDEGTLVSVQTDLTNTKIVKGISAIDEVTLLNVKGSGLIGVSGVAARIFNALATAQVNIILITQASSEHAITLAVHPIDSERAAEAINEAFATEISKGNVSPVSIDKSLSIVAVVGDKMRHIPGLAGRVFSALGRNGINIRAIAQGSSERNISSVIEKKHVAKALRVLHDAFFLSDVKTIHLFLAGPGLIGKTVLSLLKSQEDYLLRKYRIQFKLVGLAKSAKYLIDDEGIDLADWNTRLKNDAISGKVSSFVKEMFNHDLSNSIFVDCSSSQQIADLYQSILEKSISIATPNKKAASSNNSYFSKLKETAIRTNARFNYETNVGAGLPMIHTVRDLLNTGDDVHRIEGVFSGTLSYLFNTYDGEKPFSELVKSAQKLGYTEPDPRDDLNGMDMARKILILLREAGYQMELKDIEVDSLVPESSAAKSTIESFFLDFAQYDEVMKERLAKAKNKQQKLCYIASFDGEKAKVSLESIGSDHPFYSLKAMDNILAVYSSHYDETPLVVRGPGAGAKVTAAGVIADILRIAESSALIQHKQL
jgi:aspartokinase/homoserine dehydrogenase 1